MTWQQHVTNIVRLVTHQPFKTSECSVTLINDRLVTHEPFKTSAQINDRILNWTEAWK